MKLGKKKFVPLLMIYSIVILFIIFIMQPLSIFFFGEHIDMLFPKGIIALEQRNLLFLLQGLMLLVIIPVYLMFFIFSWKYRAYNSKAIYDPDLIDNTLAEYFWWGIPLVLTAIISVITYIKTDQLDPFKPIQSDKKTMTIQVVALQWKWLFLYPDEGVASLNFFQFPEQTPVRFEITADAPMNSFWIPSLGGQIYAMPKMKTELNLIANQIGNYRGSSANLSGEGFAGMNFIAKASSEEDYRKWLEETKKAPIQLDMEKYKQLAKPSSNHSPETYFLKDNDLFNKIIMKYMHPTEG